MITALYRDIGIENELEQVQEIIQDQLRRSTPFIREALGGLMEHSGKMLRPALLLLASRFGEGDKDKLFTLAAAVEMLHMATLIHDDIIDQAPSRRGIPTIHTIYGSRNAVLIGDFLFTRSFQLAADYTDMDAGRQIARAINSICESEIRQHERLFPAAVAFREYHRRIMGKTAALFAISAYIGAYQSEVAERTCRRLRKIGANIGAGFQIIDDILDFSDVSVSTGKTPGADIRQGIVNLPLLFALEKDDGTLAKHLNRRVRKGRRLRNIIAQTKNLEGIDRARSCARAYTAKALESIRLLPDSVYRSQLEDFTVFLLKRAY
ncbi:MAG: polyprenyl synthetase family protein [Spirochaetota bacterium]|nr:polyprenyl synthetase family protein [Spirochaetota bacterium]